MPIENELDEKTQTIISLMKERGYKCTATGANGDSLFFLKKIDDVISVHALARVSRLTVALDIIGTLDMGVKLATESIIIDSNAFDKTEEALIKYANVLLNPKANDSTNTSTLDKPGPVQERREDNKEKKVEKTIEERKKEFWEQIRQEGKSKGYEKAMCLEFYEYWTETNEGGKRFRREKETTWDTSRRLGTWLRNDERWRRRYESIQDKKAQQQNVELAQTGTKHISTKGLF